jgi:hypothetical protein
LQNHAESIRWQQQFHFAQIGITQKWDIQANIGFEKKKSSYRSVHRLLRDHPGKILGRGQAQDFHGLLASFSELPVVCVMLLLKGDR